MALRVVRTLLGTSVLVIVGFGIWAYPNVPGGPCFTVGTRMKLAWQYRAANPDAVVLLPSRMSLTPQGSEWFWRYFHLTHPFGQPKVKVPEWESWIDRAVDAQWNETDFTEPAPAALVKAVGDPPRFAERVTPLVHQIRLTQASGEETIELEDHPQVARRFRSYRSPAGVMSSGMRLREWSPNQLVQLFRDAGLAPRTANALRAVSELEGGFDAINTYDTGFVSVGFCQFSAGRNGKGALAQVLESERRDDGQSFRRDFSEFGVDVGADHSIHVVRVSTGKELAGEDAVQEIIARPALAAVFVRAGRLSRAFQIAQIRTAIERFAPNDVFGVTNRRGKLLWPRADQVVASEAGLATLLDGKINTGHLSQFFQRAVEQVAQAHDITLSDQLHRYEREILERSANRTRFLGRKDLTQPASNVRITQ